MVRRKSNKVVPQSRREDICDKSGDAIVTKLPKKFGMLDGAAHITGQVIGSGIFISPVVVLKNVGSPGMSLIIWAVAGIISFLGTLSFAELATLIPESGGTYNYIRRGYGNMFGFLYIWTMVTILLPGALAVQCLTIATYFCDQFFTKDCDEEIPRGF